jgi:hypothetical protein
MVGELQKVLQGRIGGDWVSKKVRSETMCLKIKLLSVLLCAIFRELKP